jgi:NADPH:quinone reductase-like Zn-dependent oxidoreductase
VIASTDLSALARLAELVAGGEVEPAIDAVLTLDETPAAIEQFTAGRRGKIASALADGR